MTTEQNEYMLALLGALVESQTQQAEMLASMAQEVGAIASTLDDLRYDMRTQPTDVRVVS